MQEIMIMIKKKKLLLVLLVVFISQSCSLAPGMYLNKTTKNGIDRVLIGGDGENKTYIEIEQINQETITQSKKTVDPLPEEIINFKPEEYLIGSGDVLSVSVWGPEELFPRNMQLKGSPLVERVVRNDGTIFYPYAGQIKVANKTREQVRNELSIILNKSFIDVQVDITIAQYNSQRAILSGAFIKPGKINLNEVPITLSEAISLGGSPDSDADLSRFKLIRGNNSYLIDYEYYARTSTEIHEIYVKSDDVIHIPFNDEKRVYVVGEVVKQSEITLRRKDISLSDAIARAGGLSNQTANGSQVYIIRKPNNIDEARIFQINLKSPSGFVLASDFMLYPQDIVYVGPANIARWNRVISQFFPFASLLNAVDSLQQD